MKKQWWHDKIAYQIYPKSFKDSNGDGVGDIRGIIEKLDYLQELGVGLVWICPMYKSPFKDQGYDISDYYKIDPIFGDMEGMEELLEEAKKREISIIIDLVINHCSNEHEWFKKAMLDPEGEYGKYFYIREGKGDNPPTNTRSYFGGSAWEKIPNTNKYYMHMYAKEQPDLNFENPVVREKIYEMMNWWLEKGISGFRVDAIINIKKDLVFRDYPSDRPDGLSAPQVMLSYAEGVIDVLKDIKKNTYDKYNSLSIAELFNYDEAKLNDFIGEDGCFSTIFNFDITSIGNSRLGWHDRHNPDANELKYYLFKSMEKSQNIGLLCNIIENHDEPRGVNRFLRDINDVSKKMLATISIMTRGMPFLYQGQEIGMENIRFEDISQVNDVRSHDEYNTAINFGKTKEEALQIINTHSRDHTRTPMQWTNHDNGGFSEVNPWININPNYKTINVEAQINDKDSLLNYYKKLIKLRKNTDYKETLVFGDFKPAYENINNIIAFYRTYKEQKILIIANYQSDKYKLEFNEVVDEILINNINDLTLKGNHLYLAPYQAVVLLVS